MIIILQSIASIAAFICIAFILSENRRAVNWSLILRAFALQFAVALFVLYVPFGQTILGGMAESIRSVITSAEAGASFVFGPLTSNDTGFIFAFRVLPVIVFISTLISLLYYVGVMQFVILYIGGAIRRIIGTSHAESVTAAANIFIAHTDAPMLIRPYLPQLTRSELFALMCSGMSTIAGAVLAGVAGLGVEIKYLIAACFMSAPGSLLFAKILCPETETPNVTFSRISYDEEHPPINFIDAAASGALMGLRVAAAVGALLVAFIGLIALSNIVLGAVGGLVGYPDLTVQYVLGVALMPIALLMGVPWEEAIQVGGLIGQKIILNEFVAYVAYVDVRETLSPHAQIITVFSLCGFANLASIAMVLGTIESLAPTRRSEVAQLGVKAVTAGTLVNLTNAALAGLLLAL